MPNELAIKDAGTAGLESAGTIEKNIQIPYREFLAGVRLVLNSTFFKFNDNIYRQIFGTLMGSPLSPVLADIVLQYLEERAIAMLPISLPIYLRYVDDIILNAPPFFFASLFSSQFSIHFTVDCNLQLRPATIIALTS